MLTRLRARLSSAHVIAVIALFFAIAGGSAIALQGKNSVDSGDIRKNAVKSSDIAKNAVKSADIAKNAVKTADIAANAVNSAKIQDGGVAAADLAADEPYHKVGAPGEPAFHNGGENDCIWRSGVSIVPGFGEAPAFYKDARGVVHLTGILVAQDGPGGDGACGGATNEDDIEDSIAFILPSGYRPTGFNIHSAPLSSTSSQATFIGAQNDTTIMTTTIPAGIVALNVPGAEAMILDGIAFRAAGPGTGLPRRSAGSAAAGAATDGPGLLPTLP